MCIFCVEFMNLEDYYPTYAHQSQVQAGQEDDLLIQSILGVDTTYGYFFQNWEGNGLDAYVYNPTWGQGFHHYALANNGDPTLFNRSRRVQYLGHKDRCATADICGNTN